MSLRLLQKQVGAESEARRKQLGHGAVPARKGGAAREKGSQAGGKGKGKSGLTTLQEDSEAHSEPTVAASQALEATAPRIGKGDSKEKGDSADASPAADVSPPLAEGENGSDADAQPAVADDDDDAVPGLAEALQAASLAKHIEAAHNWCAEEGAVSVEEVLEVFDDLCESIGLKPLEKKRFEKALRAVDAPVEVAPAFSVPEPSAAELERAEQRRLEAEQERQRLEAEAQVERKQKQTQEEERLRREAEEEERQRQEAEQAEEALAELLSAMNGCDLRHLQDAIQRAHEVGVSPDDIATAERLAAELQQEQTELSARRDKVEMSEATLREAMKGNDLAVLQGLLGTASDLGADASLLAEARERVADLEKALCEEKRLEAEALEQDDEQSAALGDLQVASEARDPVALGTALSRAEKAGVAQQHIAAAKRLAFQLQKEKREAAKKGKGVKEAEAALSEATAGDDLDALHAAIAKAQKADVPEDRLEAALARRDELEELARKAEIQAAVQSVEDALSKEDVEAATAALEEAAALGADPDDVEQLEAALATLREKQDPEGEARRRRLEARKTKDKEGKKWNFGGKSKNPLINDRFREHEAELEQRRMLAYRGRGKFRENTEDAGDELQEKEVKKQRAEINKELGYVPPPQKAAPKEGFAYLSPTREESEAPRRLTLRVEDADAGAGVDLHGSWWGMVVDAIDPEPGQPGLRLKDTIVEVAGKSLRELDTEACEARFGDHFGDGCIIQVEPHVEAVGVLTSSSKVDVESLKADLDRFSEDWGVDIRVEEVSGFTTRVILEGAQSAVKESKTELETLMGFYARSS